MVRRKNMKCSYRRKKRIYKTDAKHLGEMVRRKNMKCSYRRKKRIYKTYAKQLGMMVRCKNMKCSYKRKKVDADITIIYDELIYKNERDKRI